MSWTLILTIAILVLMLVVFIVPIGLYLWISYRDARQKKHAVLRNYPVLGRMRYIIEKIGPELRQYLFLNNDEGKPFTRNQYEGVVKSGKYKQRITSFGSERNFDETGFYIRNAMFPTQREDLRIEQKPKIQTQVYKIDSERLMSRKEHSEQTEVEPYYLSEKDQIILGKETCRKPFYLKGLVGQSAMSYGSLGKNAITALSKGLGLAGGTWMNTGEGGLSNYHQIGNVDIMAQIGPGLFGFRTAEGDFSWELFKQKSELDQIKAFELKLGQGAKIRGGHVEAEKVTPEIAEIRSVKPWTTIDSPNRFRQFNDTKGLLDFIEQLREIGGKPVGFKMVVGSRDEVEEMVKVMAEEGKVPDFITVDGGEGGTGATYQELADGPGLPLYTALPIVHEILKKYQIRNRVKLIASGKLVTPDKMAYALCLGADLITTARAFMISVGCIMAQTCHSNTCPVGVATTDPDREKALVVEEKMYRVCNYVVSTREGLFNLAAAAGLASPTEFNDKHIMYKAMNGQLFTGSEYMRGLIKPSMDQMAL
ncbi:FMN-binding glutamate synthase family protein [Bacillus dakarensis]|uniref:FMN-binding glutamate synthase family protein n=1 Tax=Robertmurraya dakarensis TaxID=1926278 RepID=UPI0009813854|nr:FMN-binding glutamate synthase family protein [Bacillus dakarensis]